MATTLDRTNNKVDIRPGIEDFQATIVVERVVLINRHNILMGTFDPYCTHDLLSCIIMIVLLKGND